MAVEGEISARVAELEMLDLAAIESPRELELVAGRVASVVSWAQALQTRVARRAAELAEHSGRGAGAVEVVQRGTGVSAREARTIARRAEVTSSLPSLGDALAEGKVTAEHVDVLGRAMLGLSEAKLAELVGFESALLRAAVSSTPELWAKRVRWFVDDLDTSHVRNELERARKLTKLRIWQEKASGMVQLRGAIEPVAGERLWNALRRETNRLLDASRRLPGGERLTDEQAAAHVLVSLVAGGHDARHGPNATDLVVLVGLERLTDEPDGRRVCETSRGTPLPVDWVRRMAHDANIVPLVIDQAGLTVELDKASRRRLASFVQRAMLRAMHDTCIVTGCDVPFDDCEVHHLVAYNGRNTRIGNMGPLCPKHHHDVHDRGWQIILDADRHVTIRLPDGTIWADDKYRSPGREPPGPLFADDEGVSPERIRLEDREPRGPEPNPAAA